MKNLKFYMQVLGTSAKEIKDLEVSFDGLLVSAIEGINARGKNKNIYTEKFAEQNGVNVWLGTPYYESTNIALKLYFVGDYRQQIYDNFLDYINGKKLYYWDNYHKKKVVLIYEDAPEPKEEKYGSAPNIEVTLKFTNINGTYENINTNL